MEENKIVAIISTLAAGAIATVAVAMNWRKIHRAAGKAKKVSLVHLKQLKATINHIRPQKSVSALRKKPKGQTEELVANRIASESSKETKTKKAGNGNNYGQKILEFLTQNPGGFSLAQLGTNLGVPYVALVQPTKKLLQQGSLKKEGNLYTLNQMPQSPELIPEAVQTQQKMPTSPPVDATPPALIQESSNP